MTSPQRGSPTKAKFPLPFGTECGSYFNYDKPQLWVILIMGRENYYRKASLNFFRALWGGKPEGLLPETCPNFFFFFCLGRDPLGTCDKPQLWGRKNYRKGKFFQGNFALVADRKASGLF
jgi:hypothetical protein